MQNMSHGKRSGVYCPFRARDMDALWFLRVIRTLVVGLFARASIPTTEVFGVHAKPITQRSYPAHDYKDKPP